MQQASNNNKNSNNNKGADLVNMSVLKNWQNSASFQDQKTSFPSSFKPFLCSPAPKSLNLQLVVDSRQRVSRCTGHNAKQSKCGWVVPQLTRKGRWDDTIFERTAPQLLALGPERGGGGPRKCGWVGVRGTPPPPNPQKSHFFLKNAHQNTRRKILTVCTRNHPSIFPM